ncbi:MAG TPA: hypothetical protein VN524_19430, partial [Hyphomicrobiaceae bacterium]|nr:hypothetical protein [Hyphomicrobiaceae bacterium]
TAALTTALSGALAGVGAAAAPIIAGITSYLSNSEEAKARNAGYTNNPIKGALYSNATAGVGGAQSILDALAGQGGIDQVSTADLEQILPSLTNLLMPYYATAEGGHGPIRASDTLTGGHGSVIAGNTPPGLGGADQYTGNFTTAQSGLTDVVNALLKRGVSYEDLGKLPASGDWVQQTLDVNNPLQALYAARAPEYDAAAAPLLASARTAARQTLDPQEAMHMAAEGLNPATFGYSQDPQGNWGTSGLYNTATPANLFEAAQGSAPLAPDAKTHASGLITSMYGGPLWTALSRMGVGGPDLQTLIQQHFNPWATVGGFAPPQLTGALEPILRRLAMQTQGQGQEFTSAGPTSGSGE